MRKRKKKKHVFGRRGMRLIWKRKKMLLFKI